MNEFEAHESSYDHQHKKRLKEMKEMQRQVQTAGRKEEKGPLMSIKLGSASSKTGGGGFKKGGFKNAFAPANDANNDEKKVDDDDEDNVFVKKKAKDEKRVEEEDSDVTDQEDYYDPRRPTGCTPSCPGVAT